MTPERWQQIEKVYNSALNLEEGQRSRFLEQACAGDDALRREVESLLSLEKPTREFLVSPALEMVAKLVAEDQTSALIGQHLGSYEILSLLGKGGMGQVYRAKDTRLGREVALKLLPSELRSDRERMERFGREARAASALNHPNVAHIYEIGEAEGMSFIAMEYVRGQTLEAKIGGCPLDIPQIVEIGIQASDALDEAHSKGITHRDIKPGNLMLTPRGQVKVLDFGLAKFVELQAEGASTTVTQTLSTPGMVMGTVQYMSPEQVLGREVDNRTDIFSLGVVLYEMTTGRLPFAGPSASETMDHILHVHPEAIARFNYSVPAELERIVRKCLEKDRERRYQSARELLVDLRNLKRDSDSGVATAIIRKKEAPKKRLMPRRLFVVSTMAALVVAVAVLIYLSMFRKMPATNIEIKSLAVLPLSNLSGDPNQDYFAEGVTEALTTHLAKIKALRVISRTSMMGYKGTRKPLPEIAQELKVDAIVEGSVIRSGTQVQVTAQLIEAATDRHLWAESYERDIRDILALQNEVARTISGEIKVKLTPQEQARMTRVPSVNPEAYDYYLRAKHYGSGGKLENETAIGLLERAVAIDPNFAAGYAQLATAYSGRHFFFTPDEKQWDEKATAAAEKALSLDPDSVEAYLALGAVLWTRSNHFPHERAARNFHHALSLNPNSDVGHDRLALIYNHVGLLDKGLQEAQKSLAVNPNFPPGQIANSLLWQGKYEEAFAKWQAIPKESNPSVVGSHLAWALLQLGRKEEAAAKINEFLRDYPEDPGGLLTGMHALLLAASGEERKSEAKIKIALEKRSFGHFHHTAHYLASAYALMNKPEPAIYWLQQAAETGFPCYPLFEHDPNLNSLRKDARFISFMEQLKKQWEHYKTTL